MNIVGVDIGGTFTDLVGCVDGRIGDVEDPDGAGRSDPRRGREPGARRLRMPALDEVLHGSTIAINTVLERKGARTALITTRGFRDTYAIGRGNRIKAFNLFFQRPQPLIPRGPHLRDLPERINAKGEVLPALDEAELQALVGNEAHGAEGRGGRGLLPAFLCQSGARAARRRGFAQGAAQPIVRHAVARDRARIPRIRAHLDDRAQRLRRAAGAGLSAAARGTSCARKNSAARSSIMRSNGGVMSRSRWHKSSRSR